MTAIFSSIGTTGELWLDGLSVGADCFLTFSFGFEGMEDLIGGVIFFGITKGFGLGGKSFSTDVFFTADFSFGAGPGSEPSFGTGADPSFSSGAHPSFGTRAKPSIGDGAEPSSVTDLSLGTTFVFSDTEGFVVEGLEPDGSGSFPFEPEGFSG